MELNPSTLSITEIQGLYGPLRVLEGKIQRLWAFEDLQPGEWITRNGNHLKVENPGFWNRAAGPDFLESVININGKPLIGDIEVHLYREDWWRHQHHLNPAFNKVVLHVVLFAGGMDIPVATASGLHPEEWIMGPWIREDVESVSGGSPGLFGEWLPEIADWLESDHPEVIAERLSVGADRRWKEKESMAYHLLNSKGWEGGLHRMVLYYLGFPLNRKPFFEMANAYPVNAWRDPAILGVVSEKWRQSVSWHVGRPANRAKGRLEQYIRLNRDVPDWFNRLRNPPGDLISRSITASASHAATCATKDFRTQAGLSGWMKWLSSDVLCRRINPTLVERLWIDVFIPLLASDGSIPREVAFSLWFHSRCSTFPAGYRDLLCRTILASPGRYCFCNGWIQGFIWLEDQLRLEKVRESLGLGHNSRTGSGA